MTRPYDPVKAHEYYLRTRKLKGRIPGQRLDETLRRAGGIQVRTTTKSVGSTGSKSEAQARVLRLTTKLRALQDALREAEEALQKKRSEARKSEQTAKKEAQKNSDGKTTVKERVSAKKYRDTHKAEIAAKEKQTSRSSGGGGSGTSSVRKSVSEMSESELTDRISKIKTLISNAKQQIQAANTQVKSMSHSEFIHSSGPLAVTTH